MTVYVVANPKGGTTKTTTAAELGARLGVSGRSVLLLDLDEQGNLTARAGLPPDAEVEAVAADVLTGTATIAQAAVPAPSVPHGHIIAGTHDLATLDGRPEVITALRDGLPHEAKAWQDVVIDTPPAMGLVTLAALAAADVVMAAVTCTTESYDQLSRLVAIIDERVAPRLHPGQRVHWIIPTRYDKRRAIDREVIELLGEEYPGRVTTPVREAVAAADAYTAGQPVGIYRPQAGITLDYADALSTIIYHATNSTN